MPRYTFKEGTCAECGSEYQGLICDENQHLNTCPKCRGDAAVINARTLYYREFIPHWDSGLGKYIKSKRERQDEIARQGLVEMVEVAHNDNYLLDDLQSHADMKRREKDKRESEKPPDDKFIEIYKEVEARSGRTF